jgi:H+/Cl- antiporter ClcA
MATDPYAMLRSRGYIVLLVFAALLGVPIAVGAYGFLVLVADLQSWIFGDLPDGLGFDGTPRWWPIVPLVVAGFLVGAIITYLPGRGGHSPADGFKAGEGAPTPIELPGVLLAAVLSLGLGAVIGPEAPLIALGGGVAALAVRLVKKDAPAQALLVIGGAGSFAAISALLGSPLLGAFLLMEAIAVGGLAATTVLLPGLLAAGIGALVFIGFGERAGVGDLSLAVPGLPAFDHPNGAQFGWAIVIGLSAAVVGSAIRLIGVTARRHVERRLLLWTPVAGLMIALLAILYVEVTDKGIDDVLFSGQTDLPTLVGDHASYTVGALLLLILCKGLAYGVSLSAFRGGPVFPAMFIGAAGGIAMSHLPGMSLVPAVAMGIGAMTAVLLRLPLTAVLLSTLLLGTDGLAAMPVAIVAVVVAFIASAWFVPYIETIAADGAPADVGPTASEPTPVTTARPAPS